MRLPFPRVLLPVTALAVLTACAQPAETPAGGEDVRAAEAVFEEEPVVEPDPSGESAVLRVSTRMDMACAVVFGRERSLGDGIATDADMGGGAHADHEAVLRGLEPDTEYFYRVQGSGADGNLYRSELMTFRTPPAAEPDAAGADPAGENLAQGAEVVDVSSEFSAGFAGPLAVDGNLGTEWSSAGDGDDASITLDLGREVEVGGVALRSRSMSDGSSVVETFTVTVDDGETFGPFEAGTAGAVNETRFTGRVLRIDAERTTGGNTGAAEIEVYEG